MQSFWFVRHFADFFYTLLTDGQKECPVEKTMGKSLANIDY